MVQSPLVNPFEHRPSIGHRHMENGVSTSNRGQRALAAIVVTDAVNSSARMSVDEESTLTLIQRDLQLMEDICGQFDGQVLKSMGDGLLMYFVSAVQAVAGALEMQTKLTERAEDVPEEEVLTHRIGIHLGDVFISQSDVMGNGVNIAARLQSEAEPGGICISQTAYDVVKSRLSLNATYAGPLTLKNIQDPVPAYQIPSPHKPEPPPKQRFSKEQLSPDMLVGGRYKIQRILGQGGFGRSYLVSDNQRFGELCVLKEFVPANKSNHVVQKALALFKREAKTLYQINHPQIPKFLACFTQAQRLFIVQEYVNGTTYAQLLRECKRQGQYFSEEEVIQWLRDMLRVLEYLHGLNLVHRDISPDNIMFCRDRGLPVLIDFGLVNDALTKIWNEEPDTQESSRRASVVGKLGYSPPEQIRMGQCYPASDLYALAVTAIVLLTGKNPNALIDQDSLEWLWRSHITLSQPLTRILEKMLMQQPRERYPSAREVLADLQPYFDEDIISEAFSVVSPKTSLDTPVTQLVEHESPAPINLAGSSFPSAEGAVIPSPKFIDHCQQELARSIGPMASYIVEDVLDQHPNITPRQLVEHLANEIADPHQAAEFRSRIVMASEPTLIETPSQPHGHSSGNFADHSAAQSEDALSQSIDPYFIECCRQRLASYIGPMAGYLIDEVLADNPQIFPRQLVALLAAEIPNPQQAQEFQSQLL
ncbi:MAG: protein kinase [Leptolyngbyaceae cyanobacterium MO_188.B28]|nr:protein kinase [Leptolyngbyaceae cyanobacterium MO_188.B28]